MKSLLLILVLFSSFCTKPEVITKPDTAPVLEISENTLGMWDVTGETLLLRLYDNGFAEYEDIDESKARKSEFPKKAGEINSLKQAVLNKNKAQKLLELAHSNEFQQIAENYQQKCCCTDASINYQITVLSESRLKTVNLTGYCHLDEITNPQNTNFASDLPPVLSELVKLSNYSRLSLISSNQTQ